MLLIKPKLPHPKRDQTLNGLRVYFGSDMLHSELTLRLCTFNTRYPFEKPEVVEPASTVRVKWLIASGLKTP